MNDLSNKYFEKVIYSREDISLAIKKLSEWINTEYSNSDNLVVICTMLGAIPFSMDLLKKVIVPHELDFISVKSYFGSEEQASVIVLDKDTTLDLEGKEVIVLEDIVDSGRTLSRIIDLIDSKKPKNIKVVSLLKRQLNNVSIDNLEFGIEVPEGLFLVGYGLDYEYKYRNLDEIGILKKEFLTNK